MCSRWIPSRYSLKDDIHNQIDAIVYNGFYFNKLKKTKAIFYPINPEQNGYQSLIFAFITKYSFRKIESILKDSNISRTSKIKMIQNHASSFYDTGSFISRHAVQCSLNISIGGFLILYPKKEYPLNYNFTINNVYFNSKKIFHTFGIYLFLFSIFCLHIKVFVCLYDSTKITEKDYVEEMEGFAKFDFYSIIHMYYVRYLISEETNICEIPDYFLK